MTSALPARLSISLDSSATASPFPSPSSSFLTPPTPGAHEFALKYNMKESPSYDGSPVSTPTNDTRPLPLETDEGPSSLRPRTNRIRPLSTASTASASSASSLFSSRPAPPSPGGPGSSTPPSSLSRKVSTTSTRSKPVLSRASSLKTHHGSTLASRGEGAAAAGSHHHHRASVGSQLSQSFSLSPTRVEFDIMGIRASSPAVAPQITQRDTLAASIIALSSSEGSSSSSPSVSPSTTSTASTTSISTSDAQLAPPASVPQQEEKDAGDKQNNVFIKIRDYAFQPTDERYTGLGPLVPKTNRVGRMNRRLASRRTYSTSSISSSDGDSGVEEEEEDGEGWVGWNGSYAGRGMNGYGWGGGGGGFKMGMGRFNSWTMNTSAPAATAATIFDQEKAYAAAAANLASSSSKANNDDDDDDDDEYPSRSEMDRNFLDSESEEYFDAEEADEAVEEQEEEEGGGVGGAEEPLFPGLYRALYAFEPEGTAEMRLVEDQIVRVVGRGGGVGWAVVVVVSEPMEAVVADDDDDGGMKAPKHALVPESYLEPYKLDWDMPEDSQRG